MLMERCCEWKIRLILSEVEGSGPNLGGANERRLRDPLPQGERVSPRETSSARQAFFGIAFFVDFFAEAFFIAVGFLPARQSFCACESQA